MKIVNAKINHIVNPIGYRMDSTIFSWVVTDAEKAAWNAKSNFSGSYNDLTDKPEKQSSVKILRWI